MRRAAWTLAAAAAVPHVLLLLYRVVPPPVTPLMIIRLADGDGFDRDWVGFGDIAPALARAAIAAEDNRFCQHGGVDWQELRSVIWEDRSDDRMRGASTITMQTVKNLVLWPGRDVVRKGLEIYLASYLDLIWPKRRILEVYLNVAEWGPGVYGAEAAAIRYFNKPAGQLTRREAALLAAVLPNPRRWRPDRPTRYIAGRADTIERRAEGMGALLACAV